MEEKTYNITQNHHILDSLFFNHDRNPPHHSSLYTTLILLSLASEKGFHDEVCPKEIDERIWLEKKLEIIGHDVLEHDGLVIAPGVLLQSLADNHIPPNMIITKVDTRFAYPLLVPVDKGSKELRVEVSEEKSPDSPAVTYNVRFYTSDLYGQQIQPVRSMEVIAFPDEVSPEEIFEKYVKEIFDKSKKHKSDQPVHSLTHDTYISADDDECYWSSIQNKIPFRRNRSISQLELLAKIPRILSKESDELEKNAPEGYKPPERDLDPFLRYAEKEKEYGMGNGKNIEKRAIELSRKMRLTYARQTAVFDPRLKLDVDQHFDLRVDLSKKPRKGMHLFITEAVSGKDILFTGEAKIIASPLLTDKVIRYLDKINYSVDELDLFRYNRSV